jgi:putative FmdB family regulatory protein
MPLYEYKCKDCGAILSELRKASEREDPLQCPHCNGVADVIFSTFATSSGDRNPGPRPGCYTSDDACGPT